MKWRVLCSVFSKRKLKFILVVEYLIEGLIIRIITQLEIDEAVIKENTSSFLLACTSPVFETNILKQLGIIGQTEVVRDLIYNNITITTENEVLN